MPRNFISLLLVAVVIVAGLWFLQSPPPQFQSKPETDLEKPTVVQYFDGMNTVQFNVDGQMDQRFESRRVEYRKLLADESANTTVLLSQPDYIFYVDGKAKWHIQAETGQTEIDKNEEKPVYLEQNVNLQQISGENPAQINTQKLWFNPTDKLAYTDDYVELRAPGLISTGKGLNADVEQEVITILAETKTHYEKSEQ